MSAARAGGAAALVLLASALALVPMPAAAEPLLPGLTVSTVVAYRDTSFISIGNITVLSGGDLTLDNTSVLLRMPFDEALEIRVFSGGTLRIVNGSAISSSFQSVAFSLHYHVFVEPGAHLVLQNSTLDFPYWVGVGDENAVLDGSTISHSLLGLYGSNLTVSRFSFVSNNIGFWLSGHSLIVDSFVDTSDVYGGILDGTSVAENTRFQGSTTADLALMESASARNTTHRNSARGFIVQDTTFVMGAAMENMSIAGIQLGDEDFRYGCGVYIRQPPAEWLNLHQFTFFHRTNNSITLQDISYTGPSRAIAFGREVWRRDNDAMIDSCLSDPPPRIPGPPLWNHINWTVTRPVVVKGAGGHFNGSLTILPGGSLTLDGGTWKFESAGNTHSILVQGGTLVMNGVSLSTAFINFTADALDEAPSDTPDLDILVPSGVVFATLSSIRDLGTSADPSVDAGLSAVQGAGRVGLDRVQIGDSRRGVTLGAGADGSVEGSSILTDGPALTLTGGRASVINSSLSSVSSVPVFAASGSSNLAVYGASVQLGGPGSIAVERYGFVRARVLWEDLRPVGDVEMVVTDHDSGAEWGRLASGPDGWAAPLFLLYRSTVWDGSSEQGGAARLYRFSASARNASATTLPVDVSGGATVILILPDDTPPAITLDLPREYYTNLSGGVITGHAEDLETGISVVEMSLDGGPYYNVTTPAAPQLGLVNYSFTLSGLSEGIHVVAVRAWDSVGNTAETYAYFVVDQQAPRLSLDFPFDLTTNQREVIISGRLSEPGTVTIKGNTTNASFADGRFSLAMHLDLTSESVEVFVGDLAGNRISYFFVARLDQEPPSLNVTSPANGSWVGSPRVTVSGRIEPTARLFLNGVALSVSGVNNFTIAAALSEGENLLRLRAVDLAGNVKEVVLTLFLDSVVPTLDILGPDNLRPFSTADLNLSLRTEPGVTLTIGNDTLVASDAMVVVPLHLPEGRTVLSVEARDLAGNSMRRSYALTVDTLSPTLSFEGGTALSTSNATLRVEGTTEPNALVRLGEYEIQADASGSFAITLRLHPGENRVRVAARDAAGNAVVSTVTISVGEPPVAVPPGLAAPGVGPMALIVVGIAALAAAPFAARWAARRRG